MYIRNIEMYNCTLEEYNMRKSDVTIQTGEKNVKGFFLDTYDIDINSIPQTNLFIMRLDFAETLVEEVNWFILLTISFTTIIYLILSIEIKSFSAYWKELLKAFLILLLVLIILYVFNLINYEYFIKTNNNIAVENSIFSILFATIFEWLIVVVGNLIVNCKKLKFNKIKK